MLDALGNIGDFVGGVGVVVTLIYLAVQVRQNTTALKTASRQAIVAGMREQNRLALDRHAPTFVEALERFPDVSEDARTYFSARLNDLLLFFQGAHALHEAGTLEDETFHAYLDFVAANLATPGGGRLWQLVRPIYTARMVAVLDERLARGGLIDLVGVFEVEPPADG